MATEQLQGSSNNAWEESCLTSQISGCEDDKEHTVENPITMEDVLQELGVPGKYQMVQIVALALCVTPFAFVMLNFVFIGYEPKVTCNIANETELLAEYAPTPASDAYSTKDTEIRHESCQITITTTTTMNSTENNETRQNDVTLPCLHGYSYEEDRLVSMATEWGLICKDRGVVEFVQTSLTLGMAISSAFVTNIADRLGRKFVFMATVGAMIVTEIGLFFVTSVYLAIVLRLLTGLSSGAMYVIHNVVSMELIVSKYRHVYGVCNCLLWSSNVMLVSGAAFAFRDNWRHLQLVGTLTGIPAFFAVFIVNETPIWAVAQGRIEKARQVVVKASKWNKKNPKDVIKILELSVDDYNGSKNTQTSTKLTTNGENIAKYSFSDLVRNRKLLQITLVLSLAWFANAMTYFGLYMTSSTLDGDRFINFFLMALLEIPSSLMSMILLVYVGRRTIVLFFTTSAGICLLLATLLLTAQSTLGPEALVASRVFSLVGKLAIGTSYNTLLSYTPELFPTSLRSTGNGVCAGAACVGVMLSPFLTPLFRYLPWAPATIFSSLCFLSLLFVWSLPETKGRQLPNTVEEMKGWK